MRLTAQLISPILLVLGTTFFTAGAVKLRAGSRGAVTTDRNARMARLLTRVPHRLAAAVEMGLGVALLSVMAGGGRFATIAVLAAATAVTIGFVGATVAAARLALPCGCFGNYAKPAGGGEIARSVALAALSGAALVTLWSGESSAVLDERTILGAVSVGALVSLARGVGVFLTPAAATLLPLDEVFNLVSQRQYGTASRSDSGPT